MRLVFGSAPPPSHQPDLYKGKEIEIIESSSFRTFGRPTSAIHWAFSLLSGAVKPDDSRFKASENRSMRGIPQDRKNQFDAAVRAFRGEGEICVTNASLEVFLMETRDIEIPEEEKLRQLAISTEHDIFAEGWTGLRAIYEAAAKANSQDPYVFHSWGISAREWFEDYRTAELTQRLAIASEAEKVLSIALDLEPKSSQIASSFGQIYYSHPTRAEDRKTYLSKAMTWFRQALEWDADNVMAQLYLAHCHHDLAFHYSDQDHWQLAVEAYENVDQDQLARDWPQWRAVKCREQLAACYAWSGNQKKAEQLFSALLDEIEALELDEIGTHDAVINIDELVDTLTRKLDNAELLQRTKVQARRFGFEKWYENLFSIHI
jgi:tetratricopeptide (TPR) repeat protein